MQGNALCVTHCEKIEEKKEGYRDHDSREKILKTYSLFITYYSELQDKEADVIIMRQRVLK